MRQDRERAEALRRQGRTYAEIAAQLGVSTAWCSAVLRHLPRPANRRHAQPSLRRMAQDRWDAARPAMEAARREQVVRGRDAVAALTDRELLLCGAVLYWCEGTKDKPWRTARSERLVFTNSDPLLVRLHEKWLDHLCVPETDRRYRLSIHESGDEPAARGHWAAVLRREPPFQPTTWKRHVPRTTHDNSARTYAGCLVISALRSASAYRRTAGLIQGIAAGLSLGGRVPHE